MTVLARAMNFYILDLYVNWVVLSIGLSPGRLYGSASSYTLCVWDMKGRIEQSNAMKFQSCLKKTYLRQEQTWTEYVICCQQSYLSFPRRCLQNFILLWSIALKTVLELIWISFKTVEPKFRTVMPNFFSNYCTLFPPPPPPYVPECVSVFTHRAGTAS
jgi:hypothetical protein